MGGRIFGLPMWAWLAVAAAGGIVFFVWRGKGSGQQQAQQTPIQVVPDDDISQDESILAILRNLQGPPSTPAPTPTPTPTGGGSVPKAVTGLKYTNVGPDFIALAWNPVEGATGYHVMERSPYGGTPHDTPIPSILIPHLAAPDTTHVITVYGVNKNGQGPGASIAVHTTGRFIGPRPRPVNPDIDPFGKAANR